MAPRWWVGARVRGRASPDGSIWRWVSGCGCEGDGVAERFELFEEPAGAVLGRVAACEPVGAEFAEGDAIRIDVDAAKHDFTFEKARQAMEAELVS